MANWACGHKRAQQHKLLALSNDAVLEYGAKHADTALWRGLFADELRDRYLPCPACRESNRKLRNGWAALGLVGLALFVLGLFTTCSARAADPCAPYCPLPGEACRAPTSTHYIHTVRVCQCRAPEIARR